MAGAPHYRGSKGSGLPKIHAPGPNGGALCGAKRKWGVLTTAGHGLRPKATDCAACQRKLSAAPPAPASPAEPKPSPAPRPEISEAEAWARLESMFRG